MRRSAVQTKPKSRGALDRMSRVDGLKFSLPQFRPEKHVDCARTGLAATEGHLRDFDLSSILKTTSLEIVPRVSNLLLKEAHVLLS